MPNPLFNQLNPGAGAAGNPMLKRLADFRKTFSGDPRQTVQNLLNSGRISQTQLNQYAQQANEIYKTFGPFLK